MTKHLSKPYGDDSDQICSYEMVIYHVPNVKVGSTNDLKTRLMAQKLRPKDLEILLKVPANSASYDHDLAHGAGESPDAGFASPNTKATRLAVSRVRTGSLGRLEPTSSPTVKLGPPQPCRKQVDLSESTICLKVPYRSAANPNSNTKYVTLEWRQTHRCLCRPTERR